MAYMQERKLVSKEISLRMDWSDLQIGYGEIEYLLTILHDSHNVYVKTKRGNEKSFHAFCGNV